MCFSENFCSQTKKFTIFLGTIHGSHRESKLGLEQLTKWVFAWILKKLRFERKRIWPHTDPRSHRLVVQINQKKYYRGRKPIKFIYYSLFQQVFRKKLSSTAWCGGYHDRLLNRRLRVRFAPRVIWIMTWQIMHIIMILLDEGLFQNFLFDKMRPEV